MAKDVRPAKDARQVLVGTVRAIQKDRAVVRCPDGRGFMFHIEGRLPALGENVVGRVGERRADGILTLDLTAPKRSAMNSGATISIFGDARIATRLLKKIYGSGAAAYGPGKGETIRRVRKTGDADLDWALGVFNPESERESISLNVLDVRALAASPWAKESVSELLPSDTCDDPASTDALLDCLRSGFSPTTKMILEPSFGQMSVDFILPYNPTVGGWSFIGREAHVPRRMWPTEIIAAPCARRLSTARQMALSFAARVLPRTIERDDDDVMRTAWRRRLAIGFATSVAALAWKRDGGDLDVLRTWAEAKKAGQAALADTSDIEQRAEIVAEMTSDAITMAVEEDQGRPLFKEAAAIAMVTCATPENPADRARMLELAAEGVSARDAMFVDCDTVSAEDRPRRRAVWLADLADVMTHLGTDELALNRLATIGRSAVPMGFQDVFDMEMDAIGINFDDAWMVEDGIQVESYSPSMS